MIKIGFLESFQINKRHFIQKVFTVLQTMNYRDEVRGRI